jgi:hypothetical protein
MAAVAVIVAVLLGVITAVSFTSIASGLRLIGQQSEPEVLATTDLYFRLNDMDAQVANVLQHPAGRAGPHGPEHGRPGLRLPGETIHRAIRRPVGGAGWRGVARLAREPAVLPRGTTGISGR